MATIFVRSTDGSDADNGSTWALAKATMAGAAAIDAAGDTIYVSASHSETTAALVTIGLAGSIASPVKVVCVNDTGDPSPPTAVATTGVVATSGANAISITGCAYFYGLTFRCSDNTGSANMTLSPTGALMQYYDNCILHLNTNNSGNQILIGNHTQAEEIVLKDCQIKFNNAGHKLGLQSSRLRIMGGSIASGSTAITGGLLNINNTARACYADISGMDLSNLGSGSFLVVGGTASAPFTATFRNCKLPASWTGGLLTSALTGAGVRAEMYNCDSADTNYKVWVEDFAGSIKDETTIVRSSGATDGTTSLSWKMATTSNAEFPQLTLRSPEIVKWNDTTGSAITVTVEVVHDSVGSGTSSALTDKEAWLEVQYLGTSGVPLGSFISDRAADILATAADQTSSSSTWTTTGLTTPVKQALAVTFTPQEKGFIHAVVHLAGASDTVYIDPLLTVS